MGGVSGKAARVGPGIGRVNGREAEWVVESTQV